MIAEPLTLPCGAVLSNRLAKGAMTEGLASPLGVPTPELQTLYRVWSSGGAGMLLSGNVQIDGGHLERPGNVILDKPADAAMKAALREWAASGTANGTHFWMQLSHAGRQTQTSINPTPKAPSAVQVGLPGGRFGVPVPLTHDEILELIGRFANAAAAAKEAGFTGVQIHAAHGYLISQFLSPRTNLRDDQWGGALENRARLLLDTVAAVRVAVGPSFPVSVKLNSADFQRGGFEFEDSLTVARWLEQAGVDLLEISGGSYEQPAMMDTDGIEAKEEPKIAASTAAREAYFVDFAKAMKAELKTMPLMVTGGFRTRKAMEHALATGSADIVGIGRPLCASPAACKSLLDGSADLPRYEDELALLPAWLAWLGQNKLMRAISGFGVQMWYYAQIDHIGRHGHSKPDQSVISAMMQIQRHEKAWLRARHVAVGAS